MQVRNLFLPLVFAVIAAAVFITMNMLGANQEKTNPLAATQPADTPGASQETVAELAQDMSQLEDVSNPQTSDGVDVGQIVDDIQQAQSDGAAQDQDGDVAQGADESETETAVADAQDQDGQTDDSSQAIATDTSASTTSSSTETPQTAEEAATTQAAAAQENAAQLAQADAQTQEDASETLSQENAAEESQPSTDQVVEEAIPAEQPEVQETTDVQITLETPGVATDSTPDTDAPSQPNEATADEPISEDVASEGLASDDTLDPTRPEAEPMGLIVELTPLPAEEQPRFGRTKLENNGTIYVIQGSGVPGTLLELLANDRVIAKTDVDPGGAWSLYETSALPAGLHVLTLRSSLSDGRIGVSDDFVTVYVDPQSDNLEAELAVLQGEGGRLTMLSGPRFVTDLIPQALSYSEAGLRMTGKAPAGSEVLFVLPGQTLATAPSALIGADGTWDLALEGGEGQSGALIQRNPVTGAEIARKDLPLPMQPDLIERSVQEAGEGRALKIKGTTYYFF